MHGQGKRRGTGGGRAIVDALAVLERERVPKGERIPARVTRGGDRLPWAPTVSGYSGPYTLPGSGTVGGERLA
jgi:hypothetical protein